MWPFLIVLHFSPWEPPNCCKALTKRRCNSGDQHLLFFLLVWWLDGCCSPDRKFDWALGAEDETALLQLALDGIEPDSSFRFFIPGVKRVSPWTATGISSFSSFLIAKPKFVLNGINTLAPSLFLHPWNGSSSFLCSKPRKKKVFNFSKFIHYKWLL